MAERKKPRLEAAVVFHIYYISARAQCISSYALPLGREPSSTALSCVQEGCAAPSISWK